MTPDDFSTAPGAEPLTTRLKHELRRRRLTVQAVERLSPNMVRVTLEGAELDNFLSAAPDDHIKLFFDTGEDKPVMRDFTPRHYDSTARTLTVDFVLHEGGPAGAFAAEAQVGDTLEIGGPRGSLIVSERVKNWLLVGDETALPAIGRRIEELGADVQVQAIIAVADKHEEQQFESRASLRVTWVHRPLAAASDPGPLLQALKATELQPETFAWVGAEATIAKAVRRHLLDERAHPREWLKAAGYWIVGEPGAHQPLDD